MADLKSELLRVAPKLSRELDPRRRMDHPIYVYNGNEDMLLQQAIELDPPNGGMSAYLLDLQESATD